MLLKYTFTAMKRAERYKKVLGYFETHDAPAETELRYGNAFELLVAVILSAQCTDKRVNLVTPALFKDYPTASEMAQATPETLFEYIRSVSYPNSKARHLSSMARLLQDKFGGKVPSDREDLMSLPGVGRKTANVVSSVIFGAPAMAVDTHVLRVSNRLGLVNNVRNPLQCEKQLTTFIPEHLIHKAHHWLILHGRYVCVARNPRCGECALTEFCRYFEKNIKSLKKTDIKNQIKQKPHGKEDTKKISQKSDKEGSKESFQKSLKKTRIEKGRQKSFA